MKNSDSTSEITAIAKFYRQEVKENLEVEARLVGFLTLPASAPAETYSKYVSKACEDVGIKYEVRKVNRWELEAAIIKANEDENVNAILVYYPVFGSGHDSYIQNLVSPEKDIEGLNFFWLRHLYANRRMVDNVPPIVPCTPLAIRKILSALGCEPAGKTISIFNRSEVVGRPLAEMLSNDGGDVLSFDASGLVRFQQTEVGPCPLTREHVLKISDIVITGVPHADFKLIGAREIKAGACCINFSTIKNFLDEDTLYKHKNANEYVPYRDLLTIAAHFVPRVGPVTVAMLMRNMLRLLCRRDELRRQEEYRRDLR